MKMNKKVIIIVDAFGTGKYLAYAIFSYGYPCIHIATKKTIDPEVMKMFSPELIKKIAIDKALFLETIQLSGDSPEEIKSALKNLEKYEIKAVVPGAESGVIVADLISSFLDVAKNDMAYSLARRHKFYMIEALLKAGLPIQQQLLTRKLREVVEWYQTNNMKKVILKPSMGTIGQNVIACENLADVEIHFERIREATNLYGMINDEIVVQEFVEGTQYIVNTVSHEGKHFITDIWQECGTAKANLLHDDYAELIERDTDIHCLLSDFSRQVLDAVKIRYGAAHLEIRYSPKGLRLIEINSRLSGNIDPSAVTEAVGYNQVSVCVEALMDSESFGRRNQDNLKNKKFARFVYLCSEMMGEIKQNPDLDVFFRLPSLYSMTFVFGCGQQLPRTTQILLRPGRAYLISDSQEQLERDYDEFRLLEKAFYKKLIGIA